MLGKPISFLTLQRKLKSGTHPCKLPCVKTLDRGAQKRGYLVRTNTGMEWIVKDNSGGWRDSTQVRPPNLRKYGCSSIVQIKAGDYIIQEYVTPLQNRETFKIQVPSDNPVWEVFHEITVKERGDYHAANFGISKGGRLVCFDW